MPGLRGPSPLLRLQSDERLIALTRRGQHAAFEVLCSRYQSRLLAFCRHMLGSQARTPRTCSRRSSRPPSTPCSPTTAPINVRPWLYRIARNRSLNHLRRATATGVDSMDVHFAENGISTSDKVLRRESFRELIADVHELPETQRTALLLREIDALSYEQIAQAMETTVPSVKSLLVRARISLAEAAEARKLSCDEVRLELGEVAEGLVKLSHARPPPRARLRTLRVLQEAAQGRTTTRSPPMLPVGAAAACSRRCSSPSSASTASAGGAHVARRRGRDRRRERRRRSAAAGGASVAGGLMTAGAGALATKAAAGLAAAAIVTAGAVAADTQVIAPSHHRHHAAARLAGTAAVAVAAPVVAAVRAQPVSAGAAPHRSRGAPHKAVAKPAARAAATPTTTATPAAAAPAAPATEPAPPPSPRRRDPRTGHPGDDRDDGAADLGDRARSAAARGHHDDDGDASPGDDADRNAGAGDRARAGRGPGDDPGASASRGARPPRRRSRTHRRHRSPAGALGLGSHAERALVRAARLSHG